MSAREHILISLARWVPGVIWLFGLRKCLFISFLVFLIEFSMLTSAQTPFASFFFQKLHYWPRTERQGLLHRNCDKSVGICVGLLPTGGHDRQADPTDAHSLDGLGECANGRDYFLAHLSYIFLHLDLEPEIFFNGLRIYDRKFVCPEGPFQSIFIGLYFVGV